MKPIPKEIFDAIRNETLVVTKPDGAILITGDMFGHPDVLGWIEVDDIFGPCEYPPYNEIRGFLIDQIRTKNDIQIIIEGDRLGPFLSFFGRLVFSCEMAKEVDLYRNETNINRA